MRGRPVAGTATPHDNARMSKDTSTKLSSNGLRYTSKEGGSAWLIVVVLLLLGGGVVAFLVFGM